MRDELLAVVVLLPLLWGCPVHRYPDGSGLEGQLEREVIALKQKLRERESDLATCGAEDVEGSVYSQLHQVFSGSEIQIAQRGPATVITVRVSHLYSDPHALTFREESDRSLDLLATALTLHPQYDITVLGHTDDSSIPGAYTARYPDHVALSLALASSLAAHLTDRYGVASERLTISGRGARAPVASNDLEAGKDVNQRLEVYLQPAAAVPPAPR